LIWLEGSCLLKGSISHKYEIQLKNKIKMNLVIYHGFINGTYHVSEIAWKIKCILQNYGIDSKFATEIMFLQVGIRKFILKFK
jgi:hypothetical protein